MPKVEYVGMFSGVVTQVVPFELERGKSYDVSDEQAAELLTNTDFRVVPEPKAHKKAEPEVVAASTDEENSE